MTLLESLLNEIESTAPIDFDPERASADAIGLGKDNSDIESDTEEVKAREHYVSVGRGAIRDKVGIELDDPKYAGKRVSRKDVFDEQDEEEGESEESEEDDEIDGMEMEDGDMGSASDEIEGDEFSDGGQSEDAEESEEDDEDDYDEEDDTEAQARLAKELEQIEVEEKKLIKTMSASAKADVEKGMHVRAQITLWDTLLDTRIRIQRAVTVANRFSKPNTYPAFLTQESTLLPSISSASQELTTLIDDLLSLRTSLLTSNPNTPTPNPLKRKRSHSESNPTELLQSLWSEISPLDTTFIPFRNQTIEKWNNKVQMASGTPSHKKFKAINQSVLSQIKQILGDKDRLIKRTQLKRSEYRPLGEPTKHEENEENGERQDNKADAHLSNHDTEIFDDNDYYQQLLKELIESRMADTDDPILLTIKHAELKSLQNKQRKKRKVDTKASKGRKIRYHVHEKLQNFMAPEPRGSWHDEMVEELFGGLLGQTKQEDTDKFEVVKNGGVLEAGDGFKILV